MEQIIDNVNTISNFEPLSEKELKALDTALRIYREKDKIPCTKCRYCMDCPSGVDIPLMFEAYNNYIVDMNIEEFKNKYNDIEEAKHAQNCTDCKNCVSLCPQGIDIPGMMNKIKNIVV